MQMIKKISHIIISFTLLFATMGLTISIHYCGDHIKSVSVVQKTHPCKCHCPACHDKTTSLKVSDPFQSSFTKINPVLNNHVIAYNCTFFNNILLQKFSPVRTSTSPPPDSDINVRLQIFRL